MVFFTGINVILIQKPNFIYLVIDKMKKLNPALYLLSHIRGIQAGMFIYLNLVFQFLFSSEYQIKLEIQLEKTQIRV